MIWCRRTFETNDLAIRHVRDCPCLPNAWYWCPFHGWPERFLECNKGCEIVPKSKMHQAAKLVNWFGRRRTLKKQGMWSSSPGILVFNNRLISATKAEVEEKRLIDAYQGQISRKELVGNQKFQSPRSDPSSSTGNSPAMTARWSDDELSYIYAPVMVEADGGKVCRYERGASQNPIPRLELYGSATTTTELPGNLVCPAELQTSGSLQQRSSPKFHHQVNNESSRHGLRRRRRGVSAADHRRSSASQYCKNWPIDIEKRDAISSSSWAPSKPDDGPKIAPDARHGTSTTNDSENPTSPDEPGDSPQSWLSSPVSGLAPPLSEILSPISPIAEDLHPPSPLVSPNTVSRDDSGMRLVEHHEEAAGGWTILASLPLQSTPQELNNSPSAFASREPYLPFPRPVSDFVWPHHLRMNPLESDSSIRSNNAARSSDSEVSSSNITPVVTQANTIRPGRFDSLPTTIFPYQPPMSICMESSSVSENEILSAPESTRPPTAFHVSSFSTHPDCKNRVTGLAMQEKEMGDTNDWETKVERTCETANSTFNRLDSMILDDTCIEPTRDLWTSEDPLGQLEGNGKTQEHDEELRVSQRSDVGQSQLFPEIQLRSHLDTVMTPITSAFHSTSAQSYMDEFPRSSVTQRHSSDPVISQTLSPKPPPHCFYHNFFLVSNLEPKRIQVEKLQELFHIVNSEWMQKLEPLPELWLRCTRLSASGLFEKAVRILKDFINGTPVGTFEDVFAVMNLAFAAGFFLHRQHDYYSWNAFYDDTLLWQHTLSSKEDRVLFLDIMSCWWLSESEPTALLQSSCHTTFGSIMAQETTCSSDPKILLDILRNSEVFKVWTGFLDSELIRSRFETVSDCSKGFLDFESADVSERNDQFPDEALALFARSRPRIWEIKHMINNITGPLQQTPGIEALRMIVTHTEHLIDRGFLQNTREVEVTLINSGRVSFESSPLSAASFS